MERLRTALEVLGLLVGLALFIGPWVYAVSLLMQHSPYR